MLSQAARKGKAECVRLLIDAGADLEAECEVRVMAIAAFDLGVICVNAHKCTFIVSFSHHFYC